MDERTYETLVLKRPADDILVVRLNRPETRNALNTQMGNELRDVFTEIARAADHWRCVILTGTGERAFCAGADLKERKSMSNDDWNRQHRLFEQTMLSVLECPVPVIAAVNGAAIAGGCELVLLCDFAYAVTSARFALTEVTIGIMPGGGGTQTLPRRVGSARAAEIILTGLPFTAAEAYEWGLVNRLCSEQVLMNEVTDAARAIARNAPLSVKKAKRAMMLGAGMDLRSAMFLEIDIYNSLVGTADRREGVDAFNEKRIPVFTGL
jgi:enoyl-CoA hydratase